MNEETPDIPLYEESTVNIRLKNDNHRVPAMIHKYCPGLAVTMCGFGVFRVTHVESGGSMSGDYERAGSAALKMVQFALIAKAGDSDWSKIKGEDAAKFINSIHHLPVPFPGATITSGGATYPMSIKDFMASSRLDAGFLEFPWEESSPYDEAHAILRQLHAMPTTPEAME